MATVQTATLDLIDKSSKEINAINSALKKLFTTMEKHKKTSLTIRINGVAKAQRDIAAVQEKLKALPKSKTIQLQVGTKNFTRTLNAAKAQMDKIPTAKQVGFSTRNSILSIRSLEREVEKMRGMKKVEIPLYLKNDDAVLNRLRDINAELAKMKKGGVAPVGTTGKTTASAGGGGAVAGGGYVGTSGLHFGEIALRGFQYRLAAAVETAIIDGFRTEVSELDVSETRLDFMMLPANERAAADVAIDAASAKYQQFSTGQAQAVYSEVLPVVHYDPAAAGDLLDKSLNMAAMMVSMGSDSTEAVDEMFRLSKVAQQSGFLTNEQGLYDPAKAQAFFDTMANSAIGLGADFKPSMIQSLFTRLRGTKFGLNSEGLATALMLMEDMKSNAGVGLNMMTRQFSGEGGNKESRALLAKSGLLVQELLPDGTSVTTAVDNELLRANQVEWVQKYLIPALYKMNVDVNDPAAVSAIMGKLVTERSAIEAASLMVLRSEDMLKALDSMEAREQRIFSQYGSYENFVASVNQDSTVTAVAEVGSQGKNVMGEFFTTMEDTVNPALQGFADALGKLSEYMATDTGKDVTKAATVIGGLFGTAYALKQANRLFAFLSRAAPAAVGVGGGGATASAGTVAGAAAGGGAGATTIGSILTAGAIATAAASAALLAMTKKTGMGEAGPVQIQELQSAISYAQEAGDKALVWSLTKELEKVLRRAAEPTDISDPKDRGLLTPAGGRQIVGSDGLITQQPGVPDPALNSRLGLITQQDGFVDPLQEAFMNGTDLLVDTFGNGSEQLNTVGPAITDAATLAGPTIGQALLSFGSQIGANIATTFNANVDAIAVEIGAQIEAVQPEAVGPRADTLAVNPF